MTEEFLRPNEPVMVTGKCFRRSFRELAIGPQYRITFEVDKTLWDSCGAIPRDAEIHGILWHGDKQAEEVKPKPGKVAKTKGPHGKFWERMYHKRALEGLPLLEVLDVNDEQHVHDALCERFAVDSLSKISPDEFSEWAERNGLDYLVTLARNAEGEI